MPIRTIKEIPNQNLEKVKERFQEALDDAGKADPDLDERIDEVVQELEDESERPVRT